MVIVHFVLRAYSIGRATSGMSPYLPSSPRRLLRWIIVTALDRTEEVRDFVCVSCGRGACSMSMSSECREWLLPSEEWDVEAASSFSDLDESRRACSWSSDGRPLLSRRCSSATLVVGSWGADVPTFSSVMLIVVAASSRLFQDVVVENVYLLIFQVRNMKPRCAK